MDTKYLSDGRKVCVIGKINTTEYIVQEIFITDEGDEIPSGEKFTTKSIHSAPSKSYKQAQEEKMEARIDRLESAIESRERELKDVGKKITVNKKILGSAIKSVDSFADDEKVKTLVMFASGTVSYLVEDCWSISAPIPFGQAISADDRYDRDTIKLISLFGKSDGDLEYKINNYSDGSGSYKSVIPFKTYKQALAHIKARFLSKVEESRICASDYRKCLKIGIKFTKSEALEIKALLSDSRDKSIKNIEEDFEKRLARSNKDYEGILDAKT